MQVEIDRALYMNERTLLPNGNFETFRRLLLQVLGEVAAIGSRDTPRVAAE